MSFLIQKSTSETEAVEIKYRPHFIFNEKAKAKEATETA